MGKSWFRLSEQLHCVSGHRVWRSLRLGAGRLGAQDLDRAADWLEKAIAQRDVLVSFLLNVGNIGGRVMWASPRWPKLASVMNVPSERAAAVAGRDVGA
jgi:hypothetical protein